MLTDKILNFINGEFVATEHWFDNRNPTTNAVIGQVAEAGKAEVDAAVAAASAALKGPWGEMPLAKRLELLEALVTEINHRFDQFLEAECADTGKLSEHHYSEHIPLASGLIIATMCGSLLATLVYTSPIPFSVFLGLCIATTFGYGIIAPNAAHGAMHPLPEIAGVAGASLGFTQMASASLASLTVAYFSDGTSAIAMTTTMAVCAALALMTYLLGILLTDKKQMALSNI
jgi:hypothetical protein